SLLFVANLYGATIDQQAAECAEVHAQAQVDHWSLKQLHDRHEADRQRWVADKAQRDGELVALRTERDQEVAALRAELGSVRAEQQRRAADQAERDGEVAALRAELDSVRVEREARDHELADLRAEHAEHAEIVARAAAQVERVALRAAGNPEVAALRAELDSVR